MSLWAILEGKKRQRKINPDFFFSYFFYNSGNVRIMFQGYFYRNSKIDLLAVFLNPHLGHRSEVCEGGGADAHTVVLLVDLQVFLLHQVSTAAAC